jgi:osmoprotectant transport system permease protein
VDAGGGDVSAPVTVLASFGGAIQFIFHERVAPTGGVRIGGSQLLSLLWRHLALSGTSVALACAVAIPLSLWLGHIGRGELLASSVANIGRAVPSLVLIALFLAYLGIGFTHAAAALTLLAIPPILTNTYVGVRAVEPDVVDAARGMGMTGPRIVTRIELPLALPLIFGGIRTSAVNVIATATIAPLIGYVTLGDTILSPQIYGSDGQLGGAMIVAALAIATEVLFAALQRAVTPAGLKASPQASRLRRRAAVLPTMRKTGVTP